MQKLGSSHVMSPLNVCVDRVFFKQPPKTIHSRTHTHVSTGSLRKTAVSQEEVSGLRHKSVPKSGADGGEEGGRAGRGWEW